MIGRLGGLVVVLGGALGYALYVGTSAMRWVGYGLYLPMADPGPLVALLASAHLASIAGLALSIGRRRWGRALVLRQRVRGWRIAGRGLWCGVVGAVSGGLAWPVMWIGAAWLAPPGAPGVLPALLQWGGALWGSFLVACVVSRRRREVLPWTLALFWGGLAGAVAGNAAVGVVAVAVGGALVGAGARRLAPGRGRDATRWPVLVGLLGLLAWPGHPLTRWTSIEGAWRSGLFELLGEVERFYVFERGELRMVYLSYARVAGEAVAPGPEEKVGDPLPYGYTSGGVARRGYDTMAAPTGLLWPFAAWGPLVVDGYDTYNLMRRVRLPRGWRTAVEEGMRARFAILRGLGVEVGVESVVGSTAYWSPKPHRLAWDDLEEVWIRRVVLPGAGPEEVKIVLAGHGFYITCVRSAPGFDALADAVPARLGVPEAEWREALREPPPVGSRRLWQARRAR